MFNNTIRLAVLVMLAITGQVEAGYVVVPGGLSETEGNSNNAFPFNISAFSQDSIRYQQVFAASELSSLGGPLLITQIAFRPDALSGSAFSAILNDIQINLSTTARAVDAMSSVFADNVGTDDTVVFNRGALSLSSSDTAAAGGTRAFDIVINLTTPFVYDPTAGNLLLDVRNYGGGLTTQFDAHFFGDATSRSYSGSVNSTSGGMDTLGLVTRFQFEPASAVPEPATLALMGLGGIGLIGGAARKRRKTTVGA